MARAPVRDALFWEALAERMHHPLSRRDFTHLLAASAALAGVGCNVGPPPGDTLPYARSSAKNRPGVPTTYATTLWQGAYGVGVLAMTREGRTIKIEGNPRHPASLGATGPWEQASVLQLYDPDRLQQVTRDGVPASWEQALGTLRESFGQDGEGVAIAWEPRCSPHVAARLEALQARFPKVRIFAHAPLAHDNALAGARLAFGAEMAPLWQLDKASLVVSFGADFLGVYPDGLRLARQWADARVSAKQAQTLCAESAVTLTGLAAHQRLPVAPARAVLLAKALLTTLLGSERSDTSHGLALSPAEEAFLSAIRQRWRPETSVFLPGPAMPPEIHAAAAVLNGTHCAWRSPLATVKAETLKELHDALTAGAVHTAWMLGGNPVFTAPGDVPLHAALQRARQRFYLGLHPNETADACDWVLPEAHPLEAWSDAQAYDGTVSFQQPTFTPLHTGRSWSDVLATLLDEDAPQGRAALMAFWRGQKRTDKELHAALAQGVLSDTAAPRLTPEVTADRLAAITDSLMRNTSAHPEPNTYALTFRLDAKVHDGSLGNNAWLQELPDPVTGLSWGNAIHMNEVDAATLGVTTGTVIKITRGTQTVEGPVMILPGQPQGSLTLPLGYGRTGQERVAAAVGFNTFPLQATTTPHQASGARIEVTQRTEPLAWGQEPQTWQSKLPLEDASKTQPSWLGDTEDPRVQADTPQWAMAIDLERCTGCHACVIACQAENNIPVVGRDNVIRGRAMHWLRLDRYAAAGTVTFQPMLCQHCEHAPCEYVCPVGATQHSPDGLNEMVYNRCVGTRFCANNCPYKVRRFNWFAYQADTPASARLAHNPEVTVRDRGVMEKCTFCVQRIRNRVREARLAQHPPSSSNMVTACQQVCPTQAIIFGDLQKPDSAVSQAFAHPRARSALAHLGTRPRVRYLAKEHGP